MTDDDITHQILNRMRNDLNGRIDTTNKRIEELETRMDAGFESLTVHGVATNTHLATMAKALHDQSAQFLMISQYLRKTDFKSGIDELDARVTRLEAEE